MLKPASTRPPLPSPCLVPRSSVLSPCTPHLTSISPRSPCLTSLHSLSGPSYLESLLSLKRSAISTHASRSLASAAYNPTDLDDEQAKRAQAPPRAEVVKKLKNGVIINLLGMGLTLLGMEATVGALVAKFLTSTAGPFLQGIPVGHSPVLALDVFLVQASANTAVSHFLGLASSLELLRAVNVFPPPESVLKPA